MFIKTKIYKQRSANYFRFSLFLLVLTIHLPRGAHDEYFLFTNRILSHDFVGEAAQSAGDDHAIDETKEDGPRGKRHVPALQRAVDLDVEKRDAEEEKDDGIASHGHGFREVLDGVIRLFGNVVTNVLPLYQTAGHDAQNAWVWKGVGVGIFNSVGADHCRIQN